MANKIIHIVVFSIVLMIIADIESLSIATEYYTDAIFGSDETGDGTIANPFKTIQKAVDNIGEKDATIHVGQGVYNERVIVPLIAEGLDLIGAGADVTTIDASSISQNGGVIQLAEGAGYTISGFTLTGGTADESSFGGAIRGYAEEDYLESTTSAIVENNKIIDNKTWGFYVTGGGITLGPDCIVRNNVFISNWASYGSGAVYVGEGSIIEDNIFDGNENQMRDSGAIRSLYESTIIRRNTFLNNKTGTGHEGYGGAYYGSGTLYNNIFIGNSSDGYNSGYGGAAYITGGTFINNTLVNNIGHTSGESSGIYASGNAVIRNNIIIGGDNGCGLYVEPGASVDSNYNAYWDNDLGPYGGEATAGADDIHTNPLLNEDYHLTSDSSCIDAGTPDMAPATDFDENQRPQGSGYDIGAFEHVPGPEGNNVPFIPSLPQPSDVSMGNSVESTLSWSGGDPDEEDTVAYSVYFGTLSPPPLVADDQSSATYDPGTLDFSTIYYWRITSKDNYGAKTVGPIWIFKTEAEIAPPDAPDVTGVSPTNDTTPTWNWTSGGGGNGTYRYKLDDSNLSSGAEETIDTSFMPLNDLSEGSHTLYVQERNDEGSWSGSGSFTIIIDTTPPNAPVVTGVSPTNDTTPTWNWTSGGGGNGTYRYKLDDSNLSSGAEETTDTFFTPVSDLSEGSHTLYVQERDNAGNWSVNGSFTIIVGGPDEDTPSVIISSPEDGSSTNKLYTVSGSASDASSSISKVELLVTDGEYYMFGTENALGWTTVETWIEVNGTESWSFNTSTAQFVSGETYTIKARATDSAGNTSISSINVTYTTNESVYTSLSIDLSSQTILNNTTIDVSGSLKEFSNIGLYLSGLDIEIIVTDPDGTINTYTTTTYNYLGHYILEDIGGFTQKGVYQVQASFAGTDLFNAADSDIKTVLVGASAGYAVVVQGKIENNEGILSHNKTANRVYNRLKNRGFLDENICYFNFDDTQDGVDSIPSMTEIQNAIEVWAIEKMNGSPAPLWIIMVDHGEEDVFYIGNETITPDDIDSWLTDLEINLSEIAFSEKRIVVIGACHSGSFIPELSGEGRIIITSAAENEASYKGPMEPDNIRSGEFFMEELFQELERGASVKESFIKATEKTEQFTRRGGQLANRNQFPYFDDAVQHALLDDNEDAVGSNVLYDGEGDGYVSQDIYLGVGLDYDVNSAENPAEILEVTETLFMGTGESSALMWSKSNDDSQASSVWMEIRSPTMTLSDSSSPSQLVLDIPKEFMILNGDTSLWEKTYNLFDTPGMYEVFYYASDVETGEISPMMRSVVYKAIADNNPPGNCNLLSPIDGDEVETVVPLLWNSSVDPDDDPVTYTVEISKYSNFSTISYSFEGLKNNYYFVGKEAELDDLTTYYWRVIAVDQYGSKSINNMVWHFSTNNTNGIPGFLMGIVITQMGEGIGGALIEAGGVSTTSHNDGTYEISLPSGDYDVSVTATDYESQIQAITITAEDYASRNFVLTQVAVDSDDDGLTDDIEDVIGTNSEDADSDDDGIIDGDEDANHNGVVDYNETNPLLVDTDGDGIQDGTEMGYTAGHSTDTDSGVFQPDLDPSTKTNPLKADTDGDGLTDGQEDTNYNGMVDEGEMDPNRGRSLPWLMLLLGDD